MIVDLPASEFRRSPKIGELIAVDCPADDAKLFMFAFRDCWTDMDKLFPIAATLQTCKALFRTYADHKYAEYYSEPFAARLQSHAAADHDNVFVLGGADNYWHFLVDHLGKLPLLRHFGPSPPAIVVSERLSGGFIELVEKASAFLGVGQPVLVKDARPILRLRNSFVPCVNDTAPRLRFLRRFGASLQSAGAAAAPERIFFRRGAVSQRRVQNEGELEEKLVEQFGFVAIDPGVRTALEQIGLLENARIIVGGHGAALTNLVFAPKLHCLVELFVGHTQPFFKTTCDHLGIEHYFLRGDAVGPPPGPGNHVRWDNQDYVVPVEQLMNLVDIITKRHPA